MFDSPLMWFAAAAVFVGCSLVLISLSMTLGKKERGDGQGGDAGSGFADPGASTALFIDEPLSTDLAAALAGKVTRDEGKVKQEQGGEEAPGGLAEDGNGFGGTAGTEDGGGPEAGASVESIGGREDGDMLEDDGGPDGGDIVEDDDTLEVEAPLITRAKPRRRLATHSGKKPGGKVEKPKKPRSRPGLFPRGR